MENFFYEDTFYSDLESLILDFFDDELEQIQALPEDWSIECMSGNLELMFKLSAEDIFYKFRGEERDDPDGDASERCLDMLNKEIDFDRINDLIPRLYYGGRRPDITITKQDLEEYFS